MQLAITGHPISHPAKTVPPRSLLAPCIVRKANPRHSVGITSAAQRLFSLIRPAPPACLAEPRQPARASDVRVPKAGAELGRAPLPQAADAWVVGSHCLHSAAPPRGNPHENSRHGG